VKIETKSPSASSARQQQPSSPGIGGDLRAELRDIFKAGGLGFSNSVDNFISAEIGKTFVPGKGYQAATAPLGERAQLAASLLHEMRAEFPDAFHAGREGPYLQSLLEQLDSVAQTGALFVRAGEPDAAKRARTVLPQLLGHTEDTLPVHKAPPSAAPSIDDVGARSKTLREHSQGGMFLGQPQAPRSTPALMGANLEVPSRKS
jgi:hypothetical protein